MRMRSITEILVAGLLATAAAACSSSITNNGIVDGWSIDTTAPPDCGAACPAYVDKAKEQFDLDEPGHAAVVSATVYHEGLYRQRDGQLVGVVRSGGAFTVVVLQLADGSVAALGVKPLVGVEGRLWALRKGPDPLDS